MESDIKHLSKKGVLDLLKNCELKIRYSTANLEDYELFIRCQRELLERQSSQQNRSPQNLSGEGCMTKPSSLL
ncbi:MAG: hypothetical protein ACRCYY_13140 [Trueperaceae bacterium]